jgi:hypothetical protein
MVVAQEDWSGENASIAEIERELAQLREASSLTEVGGTMRTSVMTHCVWVPQRWLDAAETTLAGMRERHPSRTLLLIPAPDEPDGLDALVSVRCFTSGGRNVCSEVIELRLRGSRVRSPGSIVLPLLISDLPVFCRWRGEPRFDDPAWEQLLDIADRLVVDSSEWPELRYAELASEFGRVAVSDIAWARLTEWRLELADRHLGGPVRLGHRREVGLRLDTQVERPETRQRDRVRGVGERVREAQVWLETHRPGTRCLTPRRAARCPHVEAASRACSSSVAVPFTCLTPSRRVRARARARPRARARRRRGAQRAAPTPAARPRPRRRGAQALASRGR